MTRCNDFFVRNFHGVAFPALPVKTRTQETQGTPRGLHHFFQPKTSKSLKDMVKTWIWNQLSNQMWCKIEDIELLIKKKH